MKTAAAGGENPADVLVLLVPETSDASRGSEIFWFGAPETGGPQVPLTPIQGGPTAEAGEIPTAFHYFFARVRLRP